MPASENGFRNLAVVKFAIQAGFETFLFPGSDRELTHSKYLSRTVIPDPIHYKVLVAISKNERVQQIDKQTAALIGLLDEKSTLRRTPMIGFDTMIWFWNGNKYIRREKPENQADFMDGLENMLSGNTFLVSTVTCVESFNHGGERGTSATLLPVKIVTKNRFDRLQLKNDWVEIYERIIQGNGGGWKLTPIGPSLMYPPLQAHLRVAVGEDLARNVLPDQFSTYDWINIICSDEYRKTVFIDIGDLAYKKFGEKIISESGYAKMTDLPIEQRQLVGMVFAGYSEHGLKIAFQRYLKKLDQVTLGPIQAIHANELHLLMAD